MIPDTETLSTVAQMVAAQDAEAADANAVRLENWQRRYYRDVVTVPKPVDNDGWPETCRTEKGYALKYLPPAKITRLKVGRG